MTVNFICITYTMMLVEVPCLGILPPIIPIVEILFQVDYL